MSSYLFQMATSDLVNLTECHNIHCIFQSQRKQDYLHYKWIIEHEYAFSYFSEKNFNFLMRVTITEGADSAEGSACHERSRRSIREKRM